MVWNEGFLDNKKAMPVDRCDSPFSRGVCSGISMVASSALSCRPSEAHCSSTPAFSFGIGAFGSSVPVGNL
jgi:hypothetical protein